MDFQNSFLVYMGVASILSFLGSLVFIPWLIIRLPEDYFTDAYRHRSRLMKLHPAVYISVITAKNLLGAILIISGIAMLVLPGQGILTILIGIGLTDFPRKYQLERWIVSQPSIWRSINWIRQKASKPALVHPVTERTQ
ncbi:MAG: PGPGW domain-containing protein [Thiotrichales bacterium]